MLNHALPLKRCVHLLMLVNLFYVQKVSDKLNIMTTLFIESQNVSNRNFYVFCINYNVISCPILVSV